jgi:hypothetical protein
MLELLILITSASLSVLLGLFVLLKNGRSITNRLFFFLTIVLALWSVANYFSIHPVIFSQLVWVRLVLCFAALLNLAVFLTFLVFPHIRWSGDRKWPTFAVVATIIVMALTLSPYVFQDLELVNGVAQPIVAPGIILFLLQTVGLLLTAIIIIFRKFFKASGLERQQYKYVFLGLAASFSTIVLTNFIYKFYFTGLFT